MNARGQPGLDRRLTPAADAPEAPVCAVPVTVDGLPSITGERCLTSVTFDQLVQDVCLKHGITASQIFSKEKPNYVVWPRFLLCYLADQLFRFPRHELFKRMRKSRDTCLNALKAMQNRIETEPVFAAKVSVWLAFYKQKP